MTHPARLFWFLAAWLGLTLLLGTALATGRTRAGWDAPCWVRVRAA